MTRRTSSSRMPDPNIDLVRRSTEALNRGDLDAFVEGWAPNAVLDWSRSHGLDARVFRGHAEIRKFARRFREAFSEIWIELIEGPVEGQSGVLVVENVSHVRGRDGIEAQARSAWLIT